VKFDAIIECNDWQLAVLWSMFPPVWEVVLAVYVCASGRQLSRRGVSAMFLPDLRKWLAGFQAAGPGELGFLDCPLPVK